MPRLDLGESLTAMKERIVREIDLSAEMARLTFITAGSGQIATYTLKEREARAMLAGDPGPFPMLQAEVDAQGDAGITVPMIAVASVVVAQADAWVEAAALIERLRRGAKLKVEIATTPVEVRDAGQITWPSP